MSAPFRAKSPSTSSGNSDSLDGPSPRGVKSGSFGNRFNSPKGSPGGKFKLKFKGAKGGRSNSDLSPQSSKGDRRDLSPQSSKGDRRDLSPLPDGRSSPGQHETSPQPSEPQIPKVPSSENFFTFTASEDVNIWEDENFTTILKKNTLRKQSLLTQPSLEATPLQEDDDTVENIGVAYLEPGRNPRLPERAC